MGYSLRNGVSLCEVADRLLFLDIDTDRYFALGASADRAVQKLLHKEPLDKADLPHLAGLSQRGILDCEVGLDHVIAASGSPPQPEACLLDRNASPPTPIATAIAVTAIAASIARVKGRSLRTNLMSAVARRGSPSAPDEAMLQHVATAFDRAGRLISGHDRCLPQSLAVMRAIASRAGWAQIVLGVTLGPFAAHCWIQCGSIVINDRVDRVRCYTPILVV